MKHLIYGSKDFALVLRDLLDCLDLKFAGFINDYESGGEIVGTFDHVRSYFPANEFSIVLGVGYNNLRARWTLFEKIKNYGYGVTTLVHQNAYVRNPNNVGEGSIIMANSTLDCNAVVGEAVVLWPGVVVNHDSKIGRNSFLSPSATVCGFVTVGEHSFIGAGAVVVDHCEVPAYSFIKAHSLFKG